MTGAPFSTQGRDAPAARAYRDRLLALQAEERALHRRHVQLGYLRLACGIGIVVCLLPPRLYALVAVCAFAVAARWHERVLRTLAETRRAIAFYGHALARVEDRWADLPPRPVRVDTSQSLFAQDLDLFGPGSLFDLLCEARTTLGEDTLATWLLHPAPVAEVLARQEAVADLRSRLPLREGVARARGPVTPSFDLAALGTWGETPPPKVPQALRWAIPLLLAAFAGAMWAAAATHSWLPLLAVAILNRSLNYFQRQRYGQLFVAMSQASRSLRTADAILLLFAREPLNAARLLQLQRTLTQADTRASKAIRSLAALSTWIEARGNYVVRLLDLLLPYSLTLALLAGRWQTAYGPHLRSWLTSMAEFEALLSLAAYSFEHPSDPFPQLAPQLAPSPTGIFTAHGLGHPLLPAASCVRNDVSLGGPTRLLLVSGSNMSGKSTLLRAVGTNAVLAFAGSPVRARSLTLSPLTVAASVHINDSLQAGRSRFYAEILRLRAIAEAARTRPPVLFLVDELLAGTNSSDRLAGARGFVAELLRAGAIGLLSTHDLALTSLTTGEDGQVKNVHFQDTVADGRVLFDFTLRDGPVERSNGLALMRLIGLEV